MPVQGLRLAMTAAIVLLLGGCDSGQNRSVKEPEASTTPSAADSDKTAARTTADVSTAGKDETKIYTDKDGRKTLIAPFDPPTLADIESKVEWVDQPVKDSMKLLEAWWKEQPAGISTVEAIKLRNINAETNQKILASLGRLPNNPDEANWNTTIVRSIRGDVKSTNPLFTSSTYESDINGLKGGGLFSFDWELKPFADSDSVISWQSSKDGLYDKVVLRDDMKWSDGKPFTARDIAFSFRTIMNPEVPALAVRSGTDELKWVEAYDDYTVVFFHKRALATNQWNVNFPVLPEHIYANSIGEDPSLRKGRYHIDLENNPVCSGAYTITSRQPGREIVLTRRESYYMHNGKQVRAKPYFKEVRFKIIADPNTALLALKGGDLDELELTAEQWVNQTDNDEFYAENTKATGLEWTSFFFNWNCDSKFFNDRRVREAMSYAFNHDEMLNKLLYGLNEPCTSNFHPSAWMSSKKPKTRYRQNFDKAEQLLNAAGWTDSDGDGIRDKLIDGKRVKFDFNILVLNAPDRVKICNLLKQNLDQIGIVCRVRQMEFVTLFATLEKHEFDAAFAGLGTGTDPDTTENIFGTTAFDRGRNYGKYSNSYVDGLFELGRQVDVATEVRQQIVDKFKLTDVGIQPIATRAEIYGKIDDLIYADQPYTFLFFRSSFYGFNKDLRGYKFSPRGPYHYGPGFSSIWNVQ